MLAKFTRGTDHRLGIRFEPTTFEEQLLLLEIFAQGANDFTFKFSSWEHNHPGRETREGLTSVWGEIVEPSSKTPAPSTGLSPELELATAARAVLGEATADTLNRLAVALKRFDAAPTYTPSVPPGYEHTVVDQTPCAHCGHWKGDHHPVCCRQSKDAPSWNWISCSCTEFKAIVDP